MDPEAGSGGSAPLSLDAWLLGLRTHERPPLFEWYRFPTDAAYEAFIADVQQRPEELVRLVLSNLLVESGSLGIDELYLQTILTAEADDPARFARMMKFTFSQRLRRYELDDSPVPPWQGITWVLDLLPDQPRNALKALQAWIAAHAAILPDGRVNGSYDALGIIRARYIGVAGTQPERVKLLQEADDRDFEYLVAALYRELGYEAKVTPARGDGGRDIEAQREGASRRESLLIECKRYTGKVGVAATRALIGVVANERATKGVLVTSGAFTRGATKLAASNMTIELVDGPSLVVLLNGHCGGTWPRRIDAIIGESRTRQDRGLGNGSD